MYKEQSEFFFSFFNFFKCILKYSRNVIDVSLSWHYQEKELGALIRYIFGIYDRFLTNVQFNHKF
jgi:hypothetical protein